MEPAASTGGPAAEPVNLRWLRSLQALMTLSGLVCGWSLVGLLMVIIPPVFLMAVFLFAFTLCLIILSGIVYLGIVFICHTRYSLRTLMVAVLMLGVGLSLVFRGQGVLVVLGCFFLYVLGMEILLGIQQCDPLRGNGTGNVLPAKTGKI